MGRCTISVWKNKTNVNSCHLLYRFTWSMQNLSKWTWLENIKHLFLNRALSKKLNMMLHTTSFSFLENILFFFSVSFMHRMNVSGSTPSFSLIASSISSESRSSSAFFKSLRVTGTHRCRYHLSNLSHNSFMNSHPTGNLSSPSSGSCESGHFSHVNSAIFRSISLWCIPKLLMIVTSLEASNL